MTDTPPAPEHLVGGAEIRELVGGIERNTLIAWRRDRGFPEPAAAIGEVWDRGSSPSTRYGGVVEIRELASAASNATRSSRGAATADSPSRRAARDRRGARWDLRAVKDLPWMRRTRSARHTGDLTRRARYGGPVARVVRVTNPV
jgi:hypothetical protein